MTVIIAILLAPLSILTLWLAIELVVGLNRLPQPALNEPAIPRAVIIVPAHNEESILGSMLPSLIDAAGPLKILLVADNCTDATAEIATRAGVDVLERFDAEKRGKGYALDFARNHLKSCPPDVVLIIDADCWTDAYSVRQLVLRCAMTGSPCQAINLQRAAPAGSPAVQVSTFAFFIKNVIRQRAQQRLAGRVQLLGTGMAFPWTIFAKADLATGSIVEDLKLAQELAQAGHPPTLVEDAVVLSEAETPKNTLSQRSRWEGGFLENALRVAPAIFLADLSKGDIRGLCAAIHLMVPPVALLILLDVTTLLVGSLILWLSGAGLWPVLALAALLALVGMGLVLSWRAGGSKFLSVRGLIAIPLYVAWKIPMYMGFAHRGAPKEWIRTGRR